MKKIINRGTSSIWTDQNVSNWCGDSFREFQKIKNSKNRFSQMISLNRGTSNIPARNIMEKPPKKIKSVLNSARGTSSRVLHMER